MIKFRVWDKEEKKMHKVKTIEFSRRGARIIHLAEVNSNGKGDHKDGIHLLNSCNQQA